MKKTYKVPVVEELDFKDTAVSCGAKSRKLMFTSGNVQLGQSSCMTFTKWMDGDIFDDLPEVGVETEDND